MNLTPNLLAVRKLASRDPSRYAIRSVRFQGDRIEATDGHMLGRVVLPESNGIGACVPADALDTIVKGIPKGDSVTVDVVLDDKPADQPERTVAFKTTTGASWTVDATTADSFPDTDQIVPDLAARTVRVAFNAKLLKSVLDAALATCPDTRSQTVVLTLGATTKTDEHGNTEVTGYGNDPIGIERTDPATGVKFLGLLMPIRLPA